MSLADRLAKEAVDGGFWLRLNNGMRVRLDAPVATATYARIEIPFPLYDEFMGFVIHAMEGTVQRQVAAAIRQALDEAAKVALEVGADFGYDESPSLCASQIAAAIEGLKG